MTKFYSGIAGKRATAVKGVVIHNDAGSQNANVAFYKSWLPNQEAENGFAHVYIASDGRYQPEAYTNQAWHTGNANGNEQYIGWEVCQSMGDEATFLANEQAVFKDVAEYMKSMNMSPTKDTVKLHKEFSSTACPHRSLELHGKDIEATRNYFIEQIKKYMSGNVTSTNQPNNPTSYKISKSNKQVQTTDVLNVRSAPTSQSKQVASLPKGKVVTATKICTNGEAINGNTVWYEQHSYGWISSAYTQEVAPTRMMKSTSGLISKSGTFTPNRQLSVSEDTNPNETESPALAHYEAGQTINYDSYIMDNGYAWISYIGGSGNRRYVAVGLDDGRTDTTWGIGFFN